MPRHQISVGFTLALLLGMGLDSAWAQTCVDDVTGTSNVCTANDVSLTSVTVESAADGCVNGADTATVDLRATLLSGTERYDIGIFLSEDGGDAFTGACVHDFLGPSLAVPPGHNATSGVGPYADLEGASSDACGDIVTNQQTERVIANITVACSDTDFDGFVDIGNCLSWDNNVNTTCGGIADAVPGTKSKCNCTRINTDLGIPDLQLSKTCSPDTASPGDTVSCSITYTNSGTGPGDFISFVDDYSQTQGTVSNIMAPGTDTVVNDAVGGALTWTPGGQASGGVATQANVPAGAIGTLTYDLTLDSDLVDNEMVPNTVTAHWSGVPQASLTVTAIINISATAVLVTSFDVVPASEGRLVAWETSSETRTAGFFIERWDPRADGFVRLNAEPLPAVLQPQGGSYGFVDDTPLAALNVVYRLVELEFDGREIVVDTYRRNLAGRPSPRAGDVPDGGSSRRARRFEASERLLAERGRGRAARRGRLDRERGRRLLGDDTRMKLYLRDSKVYRVTDAMIAEAFGSSVAEARHALQQGRVRLERRGQSIPWLASGDGASLSFYAPPFERNYSLEDVVWLDLDSGSTLRRPPSAGRRRVSVPAAQTFLDTLHVEEDVLGAVVMGILDPEGDFWFWSFVQGTRGWEGHWDFTVADPGASSGRAKLTVDFQGFTPGLEHRYAVTLNGVGLGEARFVGDVYHAAVFEVDAGLLVPGTNRLAMGPSADAPSFVGAFLDGFTLEYPRHYRAVDDRLAFDGADHGLVTVSGFSDPDISIWDVSLPEQPALVPATVEAGSADWRVTMRPVPGARYVASASSALTPPERWESAARPDLKASLDGVDYLIIAPREMEPEARSFADYRSSTGFRPLVATLEDVQNEFSDGLWDPRAVRELLRFWYSRMSSRDTGHVLLAGKGTYDYRDLLGAGTNLVPPLLMQTRDGLVASDHLLGDVVGDDLVPEIAVGRVPAIDAADLGAYLDKVRLFESAPADASWRKRMIFVADNRDRAGDFAADTEALIDRAPSGFESVPILLGETHTVDAARADIVRSWNDGAFLVTYTGHAGMTLWANENLLDLAGVASLANQERLPLLLGLSCYMGRFDFPTHESLASVSLLNPVGGSVAVVSPSGTSVNLRATRLGADLFERISSRGQSLGQLVLETFPAVATDPATLELLATYNVLGDPAVRLLR